MALAEAQIVAPRVDIINADITGARIVEPRIVDGRIVGGRIIDGRVAQDNDRQATRARRLEADSRRTEIIAFIGAGLAILLMLLL